MFVALAFCAYKFVVVELVVDELIAKKFVAVALVNKEFVPERVSIVADVSVAFSAERLVIDIFEKETVPVAVMLPNNADDE